MDSAASEGEKEDKEQNEDEGDQTGDEEYDDDDVEDNEDAGNGCKPDYWNYSWPDEWWTEVGDPFDDDLDGTCEGFECENVLTDDERRRFADAYLPFMTAVMSGDKSQEVYSVDEDGLDWRPFDPLTRAPLMAYCNACRLDEIERRRWLDQGKPWYEKAGCLPVLGIVLLVLSPLIWRFSP